MNFKFLFVVLVTCMAVATAFGFSRKPVPPGPTTSPGNQICGGSPSGCVCAISPGNGAVINKGQVQLRWNLPCTGSTYVVTVNGTSTYYPAGTTTAFITVSGSFTWSVSASGGNCGCYGSSGTASVTVL